MTTRTHDNDTTVGWHRGLSKDGQRYVREYLGFDRKEAMPWPIIRAALASVAQMAVIPMQDILGLGSEHRMNTPGTQDGNWTWRLDRDQLTDDIAARLRHWCTLYHR